MVSEGVDIPRLRVGVYATAARTELFFRQVVGRFIRTTPAPRGQMSYLLMPADPRLKALAHEIELERRHALDLSPDAEEEERAGRRAASAREPGGGFAALSSGGRRAGRGDHERDRAAALPDRRPPPRGRRRRRRRDDRRAATALEPGRESAYETRERLRGERARLVADVARRTGKSHREVQARINRETRPRSVASATIEQLERGNALLEREAARRR